LTGGQGQKTSGKRLLTPYNPDDPAFNNSLLEFGGPEKWESRQPWQGGPEDEKTPW
jgi:hypothetical protein